MTGLLEAQFCTVQARQVPRQLSTGPSVEWALSPPPEPPDSSKQMGPTAGHRGVRKSGRLTTTELQAVSARVSPKGQKLSLWTAPQPLPHTTVTQDLVTQSNQEL